MAARTESVSDLTQKELIEIVNRIIHEIHNELQVIRMETELGAMDSNRLLKNYS